MYILRNGAYNVLMHNESVDSPSSFSVSLTPSVSVDDRILPKIFNCCLYHCFSVP